MTTKGLSDLEALVLECRTAHSRSQISDAYAAYQAGAYRAAIVSAWTAVIFDFVEKLRELLLAGDKQAKLVIDDYDKLLDRLDSGDKAVLPNALAFERDILSLAKDRFSLLDQHQLQELQRLQDDRNRCAHPTFQRGNAPYDPPAELARLHLRNAIEYVLRQPPVQGKAAIDAVDATVSSAYFPKKRADAITLLAEGPLGKPTGPLINGVVDRLLFGTFTPGDVHYKKPNAIIALQALSRMHKAEVAARLLTQAPKLGAATKDADLPTLVGIAAVVSSFWDGLLDGQKNRIKQFIATAPASAIVQVLRLSLKATYLADAAQKRVASLTKAELTPVAAVTSDPAVVARAVELFSTSTSFATANAVYDDLIVPLFDEITGEQARAILLSPRVHGSDLKFSGGLKRFVESVRQRDLIASEELDALLVAEELGYLLPTEENAE